MACVACTRSTLWPIWSHPATTRTSPTLGKIAPPNYAPVMALVAESRVESTVLEKFYSDVQKSIVDPVHVASLLRQEGVVAESLIDEISPANRFTRSERTASILRHVEGAVRVDQQSFWAFIAVLEQSGPPACNVAQQMRNAVKLHKLGEARILRGLTPCLCLNLAAEKKKGKSDTEGAGYCLLFLHVMIEGVFDVTHAYS